MVDESDAEQNERTTRLDDDRQARDRVTVIDRREYLKYTGTVAGIPIVARGVQGDSGQSAATGSEERAVPAPVDLRAEYEHEPTNLLPSTERPSRLSWQLPTDRGVEQTAYRIRVATDADTLPGDGGVWDSGRVDSGRSTTIEYGGEALEADATYHWSVRIWDGNGEASDWSERPASRQRSPRTSGLASGSAGTGTYR